MEVRLVCGAGSSAAVSHHLGNTVCQQGQVHPRDRCSSIIVGIKTAGLMCAVRALRSSGHTTQLIKKKKTSPPKALVWK